MKRKIILFFVSVLLSTTVINAKFAPSNERSIEGFVSRLYNVCLEREPDNGGYNYWVKRLKSGQITAADIVNDFFESKEYQNKRTSNKAFINTAYKTLLNRNADSGGFEMWNRELDEGMSRKYVLKGFVDSREFSNLCNQYGIKKGTYKLTSITDNNPTITKFATRFYKICLGRMPDQGGLAYWVNGLIGKKYDGYEIVTGFFNSAEFKNRKYNDETFVKKAYQAILNREGEKSGVNYWIKYLKNGNNRNDVLEGFVKSPEFNNLCKNYGITPIFPRPEIKTVPTPTIQNITNKTVYLTFDDGPGPYTDTLLAILDKYGVKATFFTTSAYPAYAYCMRKAAQKGHTVAVHTATHNYAQIYSSSNAFWSDFDRQNNVIQAQTGSKSKLFRFAGGSSNTVSRNYNIGIMSRLVSEAAQKGYIFFDWNVSSGDAGGTTSTEVVYQNVINGISANAINGRASVVLQHDVKGYSVNAVERIIVWGLRNGYTFLPMNEYSPTSHHGVNN